MKRLVIGGLSILLFSAAAAPAVLAQSRTSNPPTVNEGDSNYQIQPFDLVYMAYQGYFEDQGVPSAQALITAYRQGDISAKDIVSGAVNTNRLPSQALADDDYVDAVEQQMRQLYLQGQGNR